MRGVKVLWMLGVAGKAISIRKAKKPIRIIKESKIIIGRDFVKTCPVEALVSLVLVSICVRDECLCYS